MMPWGGIRGRKLRVKGIEMWMPARMLSDVPDVGRPVMEKTGLPGKAPIETVVVDRLSKPSPN